MTCHVCGREFASERAAAIHWGRVCGGTFLERYWASVGEAGPDDCWPWLRSRRKRKNGNYGMVGGRRSRKGSNPPIQAHVLAWELHHRQPVPEGYIVCHTCDNPPCCNPAHLYAGSYADNLRDCRLRGRRRVAQGVDAPHAKLTVEDIRYLRSLPRLSRAQTIAEGAKLGVGWQTVYRVRAGKTYTNA